MCQEKIVIETKEVNHFLCGFKNGITISLRGMVVNIPLLGACLAGSYLFSGAATVAASTATDTAEIAATAVEVTTTVI